MPAASMLKYVLSRNKPVLCERGEQGPADVQMLTFALGRDVVAESMFAQRSIEVYHLSRHAEGACAECECKRNFIVPLLTLLHHLPPL